MDTDYTTQQPKEGTLQEALDRELGAERAAVGSVFAPETIEELSTLRRTAHCYGVVVTSGKPQKDELGVVFSNLTTPLEIDSVSGTVTAAAGVSSAMLEENLKAEGLELELGYFGQGDLLLGPAIAEGQGGDLVLSVGAVLPDGTVFHTPVAPRRATGPNPDALLQSCDEALAMVAWVTLSVRPRVTTTHEVAFSGPGLALIEHLRLALRAGVRPHSAVAHVKSSKTTNVFLSATRAEDIADLKKHFGKLDGCREISSSRPGAPNGRRRRLSWSQLDIALSATSKTKAYVGPIDVYGGWLSVPAAGGIDPLLAEVQRHVNPLGRRDK